MSLVERSLEISKDIVDLGPEIFASADLKVISYKGDNYYLACEELVFEDEEGGIASCIKPVGHRTYEHEDFFGRTLHRHFSVIDMDARTRSSATLILRKVGIEEFEIFNVLNALQHAGFTLVRES